MGFPSAEKIKEIAEKLEKEEGTLGLPENPTNLEKFRYSLQQEFVKYKRENNLSGEEFSKLLEVDNAKVSKLLRNRLDEFSTDRLIKLISKIRPDYEYKIANSL